MLIDAKDLTFRALNERINDCGAECTLTQCKGQRFIAAGLADKKIIIEGIPGNGLGAYLNGAEIIVHGNVQDAVGDTMNEGKIIVHGHIGDAAGYAMRGGQIYVKGNAGYRGGIHMKEYKEKKPILVIGGSAGSFLGEYQAGGIIITLGLHEGSLPIVGDFPCTGMHGGKMFLRGDTVKNIHFPSQTIVKQATERDLDEIMPYLFNFCNFFSYNITTLLNKAFTLISPDSNNPYKKAYVSN